MSDYITAPHTRAEDDGCDFFWAAFKCKIITEREDATKKVSCFSFVTHGAASV